MALRKQTKSVLLYGGMQDDVDEFLVEAPATEYVENGVYDKEGVISKRKGFKRLPDPPLSSSDGAPLHVLARDEALSVVTGKSITTLRDGTWGDKTAYTATAVSRDGTVAEVPQGAFPSVVQVGDRTVVARQSATRHRGPVSVIVTILDPLGAVLESRVYLNRRSPSLVRVGASVILCSVSDTFLLLETPTAVDHHFVKITPATLTFGSETAHTVTTTDYEEVEPTVLLAYKRDNTPNLKTASVGNFVLTAHWDGTSFLLRRYTASGATVTFISETVLTSPYTTTAPYFAMGKVLDLVMDGTKPYLLCSAVRRNAVSASVRRYEYDLFVLDGDTDTRHQISTIGPVEFTNVTGDPAATLRLPVCGSLLVKPGGGAVVAATFMGWRSSAGQGVRGIDYNPEDGGLQTFIYTTSGLMATSWTMRHRRRGWRLSTKLVSVDGADYVGLSMSSMRQVWQVAKGVPAHTQFSANTLYSPTSLLLCSVTNARLQPIAALGVNTHAATPPAGIPSHTHLPSILVSGTDLVVPVNIVTDFGTYTVARGSDPEYVRVLPSTTYGKSRLDLLRVSLGASLPTALSSAGVVLPGGIPQIFDGTRFAEVTPLCSPAILEAIPDQDRVCPLMLAGTTSEDAPVKVTWSYTDANGLERESAPSFTTFVAHTRPGGGTDFTNIRLYISSPISTLPPQARLRLNVYVDDGGVFKHFGSTDVPAHSNDVVSISVPLFYIESGNQFRPPIDGKVLYTEGGVLENDVLPPLSMVAINSRRMVGVRTDLPRRIIYSKPLASDRSIGFPNVFDVPLDLDPVAVSFLDDKIVVFGETAAAVLYGGGPDDAGRGQGFSVIRLPGGQGCVDPASVVEIPDGIMFRSARGFHLLKRDLSIEYIAGADSVLKGARVINATVVPKSSEVRFLLERNPDEPTTATLPDNLGDPITPIPAPEEDRPAIPRLGNVYVEGAAVTYNFERRRWSVFTNYPGVSATMYNGKYVRFLENGQVWQEADDWWEDPQHFNYPTTGRRANRLRIITPWIKLSGMAAFGRVWRATFIGRWLSTMAKGTYPRPGQSSIDTRLDAPNLRVSVAYDYEREYSQVSTYNARTSLAEAAPYAGRLQFAMGLARSKCSAVRFAIEETAPSPSTDYRNGQGFEVVSIDLELGMREGTNKALSKEKKR